MKKRQRQQHEDIWNLYIQACGGVCCVCGKDRRPLQHGHILRDTDGGPGEISNLIPICKPCNSEHSKDLYTKHARPDDWEARFVRLLMRYLHLKVVGTHVTTDGTHIGDAKSAENRVVILPENLIFVIDSEVPTDVDTTPIRRPSEREVVDVTRAAIRRGRDHAVPMSLPGKQVIGDMERIARIRGPKAFTAAAGEFLAQECWYEVQGEHHTRLMPHREWERFCENFEIFLGDHRARQVRLAKEAAQQQRVIEEQRKQDEAERKRRESPEYIAEQEAVQEKYRQEAAQRKRKIKILPLRDAFDKLCGEIDKGDGIDDGMTDRIDTWHKITDLLDTTMMECAESELPQHEAEFRQRMDDLKYPQLLEGSVDDLDLLNP